MKLSDAEKRWNKAKQIVSKEYDYTYNDPEYWALVTTITKRMIGFGEEIEKTSFKKYLEENGSKYSFVGTCVNSFDEDTGECFFDNYRDVSDFAVGEENSSKISKDEFIRMTEHHPSIDESDEFLFDEDHDVLMAYDSEKDVHYFFVK